VLQLASERHNLGNKWFWDVQENVRCWIHSSSSRIAYTRPAVPAGWRPSVADTERSVLLGA
jgi:hypothetical protein